MMLLNLQQYLYDRIEAEKRETVKDDLSSQLLPDDVHDVGVSSDAVSAESLVFNENKNNIN